MSIVGKCNVAISSAPAASRIGVIPVPAWLGDRSGRAVTSPVTGTTTIRITRHPSDMPDAVGFTGNKVRIPCVSYSCQLGQSGAGACMQRARCDGGALLRLRRYRIIRHSGMPTGGRPGHGACTIFLDHEPDYGTNSMTINYGADRHGNHGRFITDFWFRHQRAVRWAAQPINAGIDWHRLAGGSNGITVAITMHLSCSAPAARA